MTPRRTPADVARTRRRRLRAEGRCIACARPHDRETGLCRRCADKNDATNRRRYHARRTAGVCTACGRSPAMPERTRCVECARKVTDSSLRRIRRRVAAKECIMCGDPVEEDAGQRCHACAMRFARIRKDRPSSVPPDADDLTPTEWRLLESLGGQRR